MSQTVGRLFGRKPAEPKRSATSPRSDTVRSAIVEVFERREIKGWVEVEPGTGPVRVDLYVNDETVAKTWAAPKPGRRVHGELLQFRFGLTDLWKYTKRTDEVTLRVAGQPVPIVNKGTFYRPRRDGQESLHSLRKYLADGYVFGQSGRLQLSKALDTDWQATVLGLNDRVHDALTEAFDIESFLCYGTLLGVVRDNGFIGHDLDFDCAYVSRHTTGLAVRDELVEIALELMDRGFSVIQKRTCLAISDEASSPTKIDLFHLYKDDSDKLNFPFGVAGEPDASRSIATETHAIALAGHDVLVPDDAERMVEAIYGANWRTPNPGFRWQNDRKSGAQEGIASLKQVDEVSRANVTPSQADQRAAMAAVLASDRALPDVVVEVGSSLGDQSVEIARTGRRVVGLERTVMSLRRSERYVEACGLADRVDFRAINIYDPQQLSATFKEIRDAAGGGSIAFYTRAFPAFSDLPLRSLVASLDECGEPGDYLLADFRTAPANRWSKDKSTDAPTRWTMDAFRSELEASPEWSVNHSEPMGVHGDEPAENETGVVIARHG